MFNMTDNAKTFLERHCPELLEISDLRMFLIELDDFIIMNGLDENDNMTDFGYEAQAVYDEIYMCNE